MAAKAVLRYGNTRTRDYTALADTVAGQVVFLPDGRPGVAIGPILSGKVGAVMIDGVFNVDSASATTAAVGIATYSDDSDSGNAIPTGSKATGDTLIGVAMVAKIATELVIVVDLNAPVAVVQ